MAMGAVFFIPLDFSILMLQCLHRAGFNTSATMGALVDGFWIMTIEAVEITTL